MEDYNLKVALDNLKEDVDNLKHPDLPLGYRHTIPRSVPMNDNQLKDALSNDYRVDNHDMLETIKELKSRLSELDIDKPVVRPLDSWDVPIAPVKSTATIDDLIKVINELVKRNQRQSRVKL